jgi:hypothetical protein
MRQLGHGKAGVCDPEPTFLLGKYCGSGFYRMALYLGGRHSSGTVDTLAENQLMNSTHLLIGGCNNPRKQVGLY